MNENMKGGVYESTTESPDTEQQQACYNSEDGAWYEVGSVVCNNGHDWECKPSGRWGAKGSSDSCKL